MIARLLPALALILLLTTRLAQAQAPTVRLAWDPYTVPPGAPALTGFVLERSSDNQATWQVVPGGIAPTATQTTDTTALPATYYCYRLKAVAGTQQSPPSTVVCLLKAPSGFVILVGP